MAYYLQKIAPGTVRSDATMLLSPTPRVGRATSTYVPSLYLNTLVAFSPSRESWMRAKVYKKIGTLGESVARRKTKEHEGQDTIDRKEHRTSRHHLFSKYDGSILSFRHSLKTSRQA
ncbi:hypothetical protein GQ600_12039 [Phytophthora cactorum]|nr:hypothetical protein GQ600_12039 [Phytophthora cactorum]